MHLKRSLSLVGVVGATAAILIATAGATPGPQKPQAKFHFTTSASVLKYLKSHGVNTRGMVIQRGVRNYAGPKCPGKGWKCTRAHRVIQFAPLHGGNTFTCSPSASTGPDDCVIVQVNTTGANNAKCVEQSSTDGVFQNCDITQTNVSGKNNATVFQLINESGPQHQTGDQTAYVTQQNGIGSNNSSVLQTIWQTTSTSGPTVDQDQSGTQYNNINQNALGGAQLSVMSQATVQKATAGRERDWGYTPFSGPPPAFTGTQKQYGDGRGTVNQDSTGVSKSYNFQNMLQIEKAPKYSPVVQSQNGPWRCCSSQGTSSSDVFKIEQAKFQFRTSGTSGTGYEFLDEHGFLNTTGHGHISQFANQNGVTQSNSCGVTGGICTAETAIVNGVPATCSESSDTVYSPFCELFGD